MSGSASRPQSSSSGYCRNGRLYASYADFVRQQRERAAKHWSNCETDDAKRAVVRAMECNEKTTMNIKNYKNAPYVSSPSKAYVPSPSKAYVASPSKENIQIANGSGIQSDKNSSIEQKKMKGVPEMDSKEASVPPDTEWLQNLYAFLQYRSIHGQEANPDDKSEDPDERRLARWVEEQQNSMKRIENGKKSRVPKEQLDALLQVQNFPFGKSHSTRIHNNLNQLEAYKQEHGHTNVTASDNKSLAIWVINIRAQYKKGDIDNDLFETLNKVGFEWVLSKDIEWDKMFKLLEEYKGKNGHCNVRRRDNENGLGRWITTQRSNYTAGKLCEDRVAKLEKIGFVWNVRGKHAAKKECQDKSD
ncbi:hypothetical protein HJC23_000408 [Cyclotella cryptica]|uniref:Helicase-associated domain-containing protein n=1 Tax=Cyclotella cryptica TaxID=29204 RepID=A0ABD3PKK6_9STRA|eukprot:CCRYP_014186-RA/>CCRYP_014186-RA protein AED:0.33 eAED:0.25 QI:0/0/0/0.5/1/1/2/0/359